MHAINYILVTFIWALMTTGPLRAALTWDYLTFSQQWLPTLCSFKECVRVPPADKFTIHGLWPNVWPDREPRDCPPATPFDLHKLNPILEKLRTEWPDFLSTMDPDAFWEHEWYKHGRCAVEDELIKDELGYFNTSLNLHWKLPIL
ncbi:Ribonuclease Oy, partial [Clonorchis sinensis]